ncbi:hypothetical protein [Sodalis sp.]|uniref:hypothetical protein n=1 Tax=Sodalis sp. (in: enterobacteria) TaxID=1898979 RepID=UPI003872C4B1
MPIFIHNVTLDAGASGRLCHADSARMLTVFSLRDAHPRDRPTIPDMTPDRHARGKFDTVSAQR